MDVTVSTSTTSPPGSSALKSANVVFFIRPSAESLNAITAVSVIVADAALLYVTPRYSKTGHTHTAELVPHNHDSSYLKLIGGTLSGLLTLANIDPSNDFHAIHKKYLETYLSNQLTNYISSSGTISSLQVGNATLGIHAINLNQGNTLYSRADHEHSNPTFDYVDGVNFMITQEGGYAVLLTNKTGANTIKGTPVVISLSYDDLS